MESRVLGKETGATDCINGKLDGLGRSSLTMRDRDHDMKLMSTCGKLEVETGASDALRHIEHV